MPQFIVHYKIRGQSEHLSAGTIEAQTQEAAQQSVAVALTEENPPYLIFEAEEEQGIIVPKRNIIAAYVTPVQQKGRAGSGWHTNKNFNPQSMRSPG